MTDSRTTSNTLLIGLIGTLVSSLALMFHDNLTFQTVIMVSILGQCFPLLALYTERWNPAFVLRYILLAAPGIIPSIYIMSSARATKAMNYALGLQYFDLALYVFLLTCVALNAHVMGWSTGIMSADRFTKEIPTPLIKASSNERDERMNLQFYILGFIALVSGTLLSINLGPLIWNARYASQNTTPALGLGSLNFMVASSVLAMAALLIVEERTRDPWKTVVFVALSIYTLMFCMLFRGMRSEFVGALFGMFSMYTIYKRKEWKGYHVLTAMVVGYLFVYAWGAYRTAAASGFGFLDSFEYINSKQLTIDWEGNYFYQTGTIGDIGATIYDAIKLVEIKAVPLLSGSTYINFFLRTLPEFIYPNRPRDTSYIFFETSTPYGGGISELAEGYFNFAVWGCFIVPFAVSFFLGFIYKKTVRNQSYFNLLLYAALAAGIFRGTMYQTFVFYRALTVVLILYFTVEVYWKLESRFKLMFLRKGLKK